MHRLFDLSGVFILGDKRAKNIIFNFSQAMERE